MRYFSYRNRLRLRALLIGLGIALVILIALAVGIFIYLQRYVVYTPDGAHLDFSTRPGASQTDTTLSNPNFVVEQADPVPGAEVVVDTDTTSETQTPTQMQGVYVTVEMLSQPSEVAKALEAYTEPTAVLVEVRSIFGNYYYPSSLSGAETSTLVNAPAVEELIQTLAANENLHLIARLPAFRNSAFALSNQECGLPLSSGALWLDADGCYWLDPANAKVLSHLEGAILELQTLGFDEVALDDFYFPDSANIAYDGDGAAAVTEAARLLTTDLAEETIQLSFFTADPEVASYGTHVFAQEEDGAQVRPLVEALSGVCEPLEDRLVFLTDSRDTRFASYGLLKPALEDPDA